MQINEFHWEDLLGVYDIIRQEENGDWSLDQLEHSLKLENVVCYVARFKEDILGFALIETTAFDFDILEVGVDVRYRKKGIASKLMEKVVDYAQMHHKENATLEVACDNIPAIALYEKFGFVKIHERKNYYKNGKNALIYQRIF